MLKNRIRQHRKGVDFGSVLVNPTPSFLADKHVHPVAAHKTIEYAMSKIIGLLLILAMVVHLIRPLGLPGLRRRGDFWKIAIAAFAMWTVALVFHEAM